MHNDYELVVARYRENIDWVQDSPYPVCIYNKGDYIKNDHIALENRGRESDTYLRHIILKWDNLAKYTVFCQGNPFDHEPNIWEKIDSHENGFMWLGKDSFVCDGDGRPHDYNRPVAPVCSMFTGKQHDGYAFNPGGQFIAPRNMITNKGIHWWQDVLSWHEQNENVSPWTLERLWKYFLDHV